MLTERQYAERPPVRQGLIVIAGAIVIFWTLLFIILHSLNNHASTGQLSQTRDLSFPVPSYNVLALPHLRPRETLSFLNGKNRAALLSGWGVAEPDGVWSEGHNASIAFVLEGLDAAQSSAELIIQTGVWVERGKQLKQRVEVWSGSKKLSDVDLRASSARIKLVLPAPVAGDAVVLGFYLPDANSPSNIQASSDSRVVAIRIKSIEFSPGFSLGDYCWIGVMIILFMISLLFLVYVVISHRSPA